MTNDHEVVQERITTEADGPETVNERLSTGGPGPNGEPDTVTERLSGSQEKTEGNAPEADTEDVPDETPTPKKTAAKKKS